MALISRAWLLGRSIGNAPESNPTQETKHVPTFRKPLMIVIDVRGKRDDFLWV